LPDNQSEEVVAASLLDATILTTKESSINQGVVGKILSAPPSIKFPENGQGRWDHADDTGDDRSARRL
jgi:hypothetical protein